jgi:uroporphyrinogen-III synthase
MIAKKQKIFDKKKVLVTRPAPFGQSLVNSLDLAGYDTLWQPLIKVIQIKPIPITNKADMIIFISRFAVLHSISYLKDILKNTSIIAIGEGTKKQLENFNIKTNITTKNGTSESLVKHPLLCNVENKTIFIIKGEKGRSFLYNELIKRKAVVKTYDFYRREDVVLDSQKVVEIAKFAPDYVIISSLQIWLNFIRYFSVSQIKKMKIIIPSQRILKYCKKQGIKEKSLLQSSLNPDNIIKTIYDN